MSDFLRQLFSSDFMPHGHCYLWLPEILLLHVLSDAVTSAAYFGIPVILVLIIRRRPDIGYNYLFFAFASFIFACGLTHLMEIWTVWNGTYRLSGLLKAMTAVASMATTILLFKNIPNAIEIQTPSQAKMHRARLSKVNKQVKSLIEEGNEQRRQLELQKLLLDELDHRAKNLLGVVAAVAQQTIRSSTNMETFQDAFSNRLQNLAQCQKLLRMNSWNSLELHELLRSSVEPQVGSLYTTKFFIHGPRLLIKTGEVQALHTIFFELVTNATKHGSLREADGIVEVKWEIKSARGSVLFTWRELGKVSIAKDPSYKGYGKKVIEQMVKHQLHGDCTWKMQEDGLLFSFAFPLSDSISIPPETVEEGDVHVMS